MSSQDDLTRRQFLKRSAGVVGAALAVPSIIPASALGRGGVLAPSDRITMGFIGVGGQGGGHLLGGAWTYQTGGYAARKDVQVLAVCDVNRDRREKATARVNQNYAETYGQSNYTPCKAYNDFREVLDRDDIDAVLIASPVHWHATMAAMAAQAGKDVYCEKPTAGNVRESRAVVEAVRRYGRIYQAGTQQRSEYNGMFRRAVEFVRSGRIGKLKEVYAYRECGMVAWPNRFGPAQPVPDGLDWDLLLGPAPEMPYSGNANAHLFCVGEFNWAPHHYDIVQWGTDSDQTGPVEISLEQKDSQIGKRDDRPANAWWGWPHPIFRYANGVTVYGREYPGEPVGGEGGVCFVGTDGRIAVDRNSLVSDPADIVREPLQPNEVHVYHSDSHAGNFTDCIRSRQQPICDAEAAHRAVSMVILGGITKILNRPLKWDPQQEQFIGDEEANRMLSAATRAPWNI